MVQQHGVVVDMRDCYPHSPPKEVYVVEDVLADDFLFHTTEKSYPLPCCDLVRVASPVVPVLLLSVVEGDDECDVLARGEANAGDLILDCLDVDGEIRGWFNI